MGHKAFAALALIGLLASNQPPARAQEAAGQARPNYLDVFEVQVKPEKRAEFDALVKKMVDANRRHKGDFWVAAETTYGPGNRVTFVSQRKNFADMEQGQRMFMTALTEAYGSAGAGKLLQDLNHCIVSSRGEARRFRWEQSANVPADPAALNKLVGGSRWVSTTITRVRPAHGGDYAAQLGILKQALEKSMPQLTTFVSQSVAGERGIVFYTTRFGSTLGAFDTAEPPLRQLLGAEASQKFHKTNAELELGNETVISRFMPELSNPPEEVVSAAPGFWKPKPAVAAKSAGKAAKAQPQHEEHEEH